MGEHELFRSARALSRDEFIRRHPVPFLLVRAGEEEDFVPSEPPTEDDSSGPATVTVGITFRTFTGHPGQHDTTREIRHVLPVAKRQFDPYADRISVGRARNCDIVLRNRSVSKLHAQFRHRSEQKLELVDLQSYNGTWVNGCELQPNVPEPVCTGDELQFGLISAQLVDAATLHDLLRDSDEIMSALG
jgi:hypothetical protein